jgi:hypothetical protein
LKRCARRLECFARDSGAIAEFIATEAISDSLIS